MKAAATDGGKVREAVAVFDDVSSLETAVEDLRAAGVLVERHEVDYPNGRFAELEDPEGNRIQLWEPNAASLARDPGPRGR